MRMSKKKRKAKKKLQMRNKRLVKKYYWLLPRNAWTGEIDDDYDYTYVVWDLDRGWHKAFGQMYLDELGEAIKESKQTDFMIQQMKEKYGQLRVYTGPTTSKVHQIIRKYEYISENICIYCGREAPMVDDSWIMPICLNCYKNNYRRREKYFGKGYIPKTDEEITEQYRALVHEEPGEDGKWHMTTSYTIRSYDKDGFKDVVYDITDTVEKIRKRQSKWIRKD